MKLNNQWLTAILIGAGWVAETCALGAVSPSNSAPLVAFAPAGGMFTSNPIVTLTGSTGEMRFTLDGSLPVTNSLLYSAPIVLSNSCMVQARGFVGGTATGAVTVASFTLLDTNLAGFNSSLPLVCLQTFGQPIPTDTNVVAAVYLVDAPAGRSATLDAPRDFDGRAVVKVRGYTSRRYPKHSFTMELRDAFDEPVHASLLGQPSDADWVLYAPYLDKSLVRDVLAYEISNRMGHYASRTRFVEVFLNDTTNRLSRAHYVGVYVLEEKVKRSEHRVNIQKLSSEDKTEPAITGGYIFKKDHLEEVLHDDPPPSPPAAVAVARARHERVGYPTGPGGFPADPAGFLPPHEDIVTVTNILTSTQIAPATHWTALTNVVSLTNVVADTRVVAVTNIVTLTNVITAPNVTTTRHVAIVTNVAAITNVTSVTNSASIANQAPFAGIVLFTNVTAFTNVALFTNIASVTNTASVTNMAGHVVIATLTNVASVTHFASLTNVASATNVELTATPGWATNIVSTTNFVLITNTPIVSLGATGITVVASALASTNGSPTNAKPSALAQLVATGQGFVSSRTNAFFYVEPKARRITSEQRAWLSNYVNRFEQALYGVDFRNPTNGYAAYIDRESFIDQHLIVEATKNIDGFRFSTFYTKDRGAKLKLEPIWDWNLAFGNASGKQGDQYEHWYWPQLDDRQYSWFRRLFEDPDFGQRYVDRWFELRAGVLGTSNLVARVDSLAGALKEPAARNFERWPILGQTIATEPFSGKTYDEEIQYLRTWLSNRLAWVNGQFIPPPVAQPDLPSVASGTSLTLTSAVGKVYFTLDGSDPRLSGGAVSPAAREGGQAMSVTNALHIIARTQKENRWSSPLTWKVAVKPTITASKGGG